jgi:CspA family cold shock protein
VFLSESRAYFLQAKEAYMHTGKIKKLVWDRGFGFISDTDGREIFFHKSRVLDVQFDSLKEGQDVEFEVEKSPKGPRAINVRVVAPQQ